jgi:putative transposase
LLQGRYIAHDFQEAPAQIALAGDGLADDTEPALDLPLKISSKTD